MLGGQRVHELGEDWTKKTHQNLWSTRLLALTTTYLKTIEDKYQAAEKCNWYWFMPWKKIPVATTSTEGNAQVQDKQHPSWLMTERSCNSHNMSQLIQASDPQEVNDRVWLKGYEYARSRLSQPSNQTDACPSPHRLMMVQNDIPSWCSCSS